MCFVGGFKVDEVVERYPQRAHRVQPAVGTDGPGAVARARAGRHADGTRTSATPMSCSAARRSPRCRDAAGEVVVAVDTRWRDRYDARSRRDLAHAEKVRLGGSSVAEIGPNVEVGAADAEFAGVLRLRGAGADAAFARDSRRRARADRVRCPISSAISSSAGSTITAVDLEGDWAELDAKQDLARFILGTKAESLERLRKMHHGGEIGALVSFTFGDWSDDRAAVVERILAETPGDALIVRSSALSEDSWFESSAGRHDSVPDVERTPDALERAVDQVFASYGSDDAGEPGARAGDAARRRDQRRRDDAPPRARRAVLRDQLRRHDVPGLGAAPTR